MLYVLLFLQRAGFILYIPTEGSPSVLRITALLKIKLSVFTYLIDICDICFASAQRFSYSVIEGIFVYVQYIAIDIRVENNFVSTNQLVSCAFIFVSQMTKASQ